MAHVLIVVARRFNGHELWLTLKILQERGHSFTLVSVSTHLEDEVTTERYTIDKTFEDITSLEGFDGLMFISGNMADTEFHWRHEQCQRYVSEAMEKDIPIGAICCSVPTIRLAAEGKKVAFYPLHRSRDLLRDAGAILTYVSYMVDGKLVTAEHQMATQPWVENFCEVLEGKQVDVSLTHYPMTAGQFEGKPMAELDRLRRIVSQTGKLSFKEED